MATRAVGTKQETVWQQDLATILEGKCGSEELFDRSLEKIIRVRNEGKFPLSDGIQNQLKRGQDLLKDAFRVYKEKEFSGLDERCQLLKCSFFVVIANIEGCKLTPAQQINAQKKYLPLALKAVKAEWLLGNSTASEWFEQFAIASYSKIADRIDQLYWGLDEGVRSKAETCGKELSLKLFEDYRSEKFTFDELKTFVKWIDEKQLSKDCPEESQSVYHENDILNVYYKECTLMQKTYFSDRKTQFWSTRVDALNTFLDRIKPVSDM